MFPTGAKDWLKRLEFFSSIVLESEHNLLEYIYSSFGTYGHSGRQIMSPVYTFEYSMFFDS